MGMTKSGSLFGAAAFAVLVTAAPEFEAPGDAGANNVYDVQLTVTDTGPLTEAGPPDAHGHGHGELRLHVHELMFWRSTKEIVIGKHGNILKKIGTEARAEIEDLVESKVFLELHVKTQENWRDDILLLQELGYQNT